METMDDTAKNVPGGLVASAKEIMEKAHSAAKEEAAQFLPENDVNYIIGKIMDVLQHKQSPEKALKEVAAAHTEAASAYARVFAREALQDALKESDLAAVRELSDTDFSERLVSCCAAMAITVKGYMAHEMNEAEFIRQIGGTDIAKIGLDFLGAAGPDRTQFMLAPDNLAGMCAPVVGFAASMAAYKLLKQAQDDAALAHEERLHIEQQCAQSVAMIRQYRIEMDAVVSKYLTKHIETFETGFAAMDKAILEGDVNGYIKGNAEIQEVLGYKAQFTNQQEFNSLMDSDTAFTL